MIDVGLQYAERDIIYKTTTAATSVISSRRRSRICYSHVFLQEKLGSRYYDNAIFNSLPHNPHHLIFFDWWCHSRKRVAKELRKGFDSLVVLVGWLLWKERNQRVFQRNSMTVRDLLSLILEEAKIWTYAGHTTF